MIVPLLFLYNRNICFKIKIHKTVKTGSKSIFKVIMKYHYNYYNTYYKINSGQYFEVNIFSFILMRKKLSSFKK